MLTYISPFSTLIPISLFIIYPPKRGLVLILLFYCLINFATDISTNFLLGEFRTLRISTYYIFLVIELLLFYYFITKEIRTTFFKRVNIGLTAGVIILGIIRLILLDHYKIDSVIIGAQHLVVIVFSVLYFYDQVVNIDANSASQPLSSKPEFWAIAGILISMSATFFLYLFSNSISIEQREQFWKLLYICNIIQNIFFCIAIIVAARNNTKKQLT